MRAQAGAARTGELHTPHGIVPTPAFMPVGTYGAVKGITPADLKEVGTSIVLSNTFHLWVRPGDERIRDLGEINGSWGGTVRC